jgi:hypothetical protein
VRATVAATTLLPIAASAVAEEIVGEAIVDGARVELLADGTWREVPLTAEGCTRIEGPVSFCGDLDDWGEVLLSDDQEVDVLHVMPSGTTIGMMVEMEADIDPAISPRAFALLTMGFAAEPEEIDFEVVSERAATIHGWRTSSIVVSPQPNGGSGTTVITPLLFEDGGFLAVFTFGDSDKPASEYQDVHADFLSEIRIDLDAE